MPQRPTTSDDDLGDEEDFAPEEIPDDGGPGDSDRDLLAHEYDDEIAEGACPSCHSEDVAPFPWSRRIAQACAVLLLLSPLTFVEVMFIVVAIVGVIYVLLTKPALRCTRCGRGWTPADA